MPFDRHNRSGQTPGLLAREEGAGTAAAHRNLVGDPVYRIAIAQGARLPQVFRIVKNHAACALHQRFGDDGGDLIRVFGKQRFQVLDLTQGDVARIFTRPRLARIGIGDDESGPHEPLVRLPETGQVGYPQRAQGFTVIAAGQANKGLLPAVPQMLPGMRAHLDRDFDRRGAVRAVKRMAQDIPRQFREALRQLDHGSMRESRQHYVIELIELIAQRLHYRRVAVAEQAHPPGTDRVEIPRAVMAREPGSLGALDRYQWQIGMPFHLGAGVPDRCQASLDPRGGGLAVAGGIRECSSVIDASCYGAPLRPESVRTGSRNNPLPQRARGPAPLGAGRNDDSA